MKRVLLVQPPTKDFAAIREERRAERPYRASSEPLGLAYLAGSLEAALGSGVEVEVVDFDLHRFSFAQIGEFFAARHPDVVGVSCNFAPTTPYALRTAALAKDATGALCVVGGVQATFIADEVLAGGAIDAVIRFEGEGSFVHLVQQFPDVAFDRVPGIAYRSEHGVVTTKRAPPRRDLDRLPTPARHLLPTRTYVERYGLLYVSSSRGCPYDCTYCACSAFAEKRFRARSSAHVHAELIHLHTTFGARHASFTDDLFTHDQDRVRDLCDRLIADGSPVTWDCHARVDTVTPPLMERMRAAGCTKIKFGIEAADQDVLDGTRRRYSIDTARQTIAAANQVGFREVRTCFILGLPGQTLASMTRSVELAIELEADSVEFLPLMPFPGTELFEAARRHGLLRTLDWRQLRHGHVAIEPKACTAQELTEFQRRAYEAFYFSERYLERALRRGKSVKDVVQFLGGWWNEIQFLGRTDVEG